MDLASTGAAVLGLYQLSQRLGAIHLSTTSLYESVLFMRDYDSFLALKPALDGAPKAAAPRSFELLEIDDVSFRYPEAATPTLSGVSIKVRAGEIVALVGENGSGKTTLAKVLAGLYKPDRGSVRWDGIDVAEVDPEQLRRSIAVIFQDFERYLLSARENIGFGRVELADDSNAVAAAARRAGAHDFIAALPDVYETMLGREWMGGYDLSMGQWQRVALARAFFRDAPFIILDEPTAALDARAERVLFDRMRELLQGRTVVCISHRFSSVRSADRIYVLQRGQVTEHGTHAELMRRGGHYAELYTLQASSYAE
jgi:ATP-binding cassette subfamily B protein